MGKLHIDKKIVVRIAVGIAVLVAATGAGFLLWWLQSLNNQSVSNPSTDKPTVVTSAQDLSLTGKSDEAVTYIDESLKKSDITTDERQELTIEKALVYARKNDFNKAFEIYLEAEKVKSSFALSTLIADAAVKLNKKDVAIEYYKKAISQMNQKSPTYNSEKARYEAILKGVEG